MELANMQEALSDRQKKNLAILECIKRKGPISKTDISRLTRLNIVTVSNYINNYIAKDIVKESGLDISSGGRRPAMVELNPAATLVLGIDLGIKNIITVLTDLNGKILAKKKSPRPLENAEEAVNIIYNQVEEVKSKAGPSNISGACVAASGVIDKNAGTVKCTKGVASIYLPITHLIQRRFNMPAFLEHDATAAAYGEWSLGLEAQAGVMLFMFSGVGCGIIMNGEIYRGTTGVAGEVSLRELIDFSAESTVEMGGLKPWAIHLGMPDEAKEAVKAGKKSKITELAKRNPENITQDMIFEAAKENDQLANEIIQRAGERLGVRIAFLINLLNPSLVVIGGGLEQAGPVLLDAIKKMVKVCAFEEMATAARIVPSRLGEDAACLGSATLMIRDVFSKA